MIKLYQVTHSIEHSADDKCLAAAQDLDSAMQTMVDAIADCVKSLAHDAYDRPLFGDAKPNLIVGDFYSLSMNVSDDRVTASIRGTKHGKRVSHVFKVDRPHC